MRFILHPLIDRSLPRLSFWALLIIWLPWAIAEPPSAQQEPGRNVVLVTLDGLRGEEVFHGADLRLISKDSGVEQPQVLQQRYWREQAIERRGALLPFLWQQITSSQGWIAGDPEQDSQVVVTNGFYFSYPGYNEILTGAADPAVDSNDKRYNTNTTVLEWIARQPKFRHRVAAFCSWDVFPFIINDQRSGIDVNAGWEPLEAGDPERIATLNLVAQQLFHQWDGVRYDVFTARGAVEAMSTLAPRVLFVALGETDDWAHAGRYDRYLDAAHQNDLALRQLWETAESLPQYRGRTLFLLTTDHGRGDGREGWKSHGKNLPGSERIWVAAWGGPLYRQGIDQGGRFTQSQIAATVATYLELDFNADYPEAAGPLPIVNANAETD